MLLTHDIDSDRENVAGAGSPLAPCRCGTMFLPKYKQRFCSRTCARRAQLPRPRRPIVITDHNQLIVLRLLEIQPLERRARGGWRFGTKRIGESLVARLIASGRAEIRGERLFHRKVEALR